MAHQWIATALKVFILQEIKDFTDVLFPVTFPLECTILHHVLLSNVPFSNVPFCITYRFVTVTVL
jgi:hypothetical protein